MTPFNSMCRAIDEIARDILRKEASKKPCACGSVSHYMCEFCFKPFCFGCTTTHNMCRVLATFRIKK